MHNTLRAALAAIALSTSALAGAQTTLLNVSYDVAREFYKDINAAFAASHKKSTGKDIKVDQSHAGSSAQARSVADGLEADVVTFNTTTDVDFLAEKGVRTTPRPPPRPCCSWCATATPRASRTGTT